MVLAPDGSELACTRHPTPRGPEALLDGIAAIVRQVSEDQGLGGDVPVGIGVAGLVDHRGVLRHGPNQPGVVELDVQGGLVDRLGERVVVDNDGNCAVWAEHVSGAAQGASDVVLVTLGTGIGAGILIGGQVVRGANGMAGEPGHTRVDPNGPPCPCGKRGCWERYASGAGLARVARDEAEAGRLDAVLAHVGGDEAAIHGEDVVEVARTGDPEALGVMAQFGVVDSAGRGQPRRRARPGGRGAGGRPDRRRRPVAGRDPPSPARAARGRRAPRAAPDRGRPPRHQGGRHRGRPPGRRPRLNPPEAGGVTPLPSPSMDFRRITSLPPYVFTIIDGLKVELRRDGVDVVDLGFGNPDLPSPDVAVAKLAEAAHNPRNHRYSSSRGIPKLREAVAALYERRFGVALDPDLEVINTIGAKEGFSHLMWVLLDRGDAALVPSPSYPIHIWGPLFAGADVREVPLSTDVDFFENLAEAYEYSWPKPRVIVLSFPHNPTTTCVDLDFMQKVVDFAREREVVLVHDFAYAELGFDGYSPPSILQVEGAKDVAVELYSMTKSFSMAGWRSAFLVGNHEVVQALAKLKSYLDYGELPAHPDRHHGHAERGPRAPQAGQRDLPVPP